jgi:hypothetical protein
MSQQSILPYNTGKKYQRMYGAYIYGQTTLKPMSNFYYVQDSWNTYNLIHWDNSF